MKLKLTGMKKFSKQLNQFTNATEKADKILNEFAKVGATEVSQAHNKVSEYDYDLTKKQTVPAKNVVAVNIEPTQDGVSLVAEGENLVFHEFGSGVKYNSPREWENVLNVQVPDDISPIGTYGYGLGSRYAWVFREDGSTFATQGYKAKSGFAHAINKIVFEKDKIIKEVLNG